jgi:hypothetical protein
MERTAQVAPAIQRWRRGLVTEECYWTVKAVCIPFW